MSEKKETIIPKQVSYYGKKAYRIKSPRVRTKDITEKPFDFGQDNTTTDKERRS